MSIKLKRVYEEPLPSDGTRVLVERLWPRGLSKDRAKVDLWLKEAGPSTELRKWFDHDPSKWEEFKLKYTGELDENPGALSQLQELIRNGPVTFVFASREERYNNSAALIEYLESLNKN